ncbi:MAG: alpha/beta fold hydrolase [Rhodospirillaceae bacterium]|nr:alpha/beta fold hydrolase [Rhodospirillales bacterium]
MPERRPPQQTPARPGPRPLPLHLMAHASTLMGSRAALPLLKNGSLPWKPNLAAEAEALRKSLEAAGPNAWAELDTALAAEGLARHEDMLAGIEAYRRHPYQRDLPEVPVLWQEGTTKLRDYRMDHGGAREEGQPVLVVPSLVNRAYILDLTPRRSLMRYFAARGLAPFLVDWSAPGREETGFTLSDYVAGRLEAALEVIATETKRKVAVVGYCMGGNLALALALRRPDLVASLTLMATPWDFHAASAANGPLMRALGVPLGGLIEASGALPVDLLQTMFASLDPNLVSRKFAAFARLKKRSARARDFVALEDWANDGVALAGPVARECLFGWYGTNDTKEGVWRIAGEPVLPERLEMPTLVVIPERDRIVPPESSRPLAEAIPGARIMSVRGGHVGMLLSGRAKTEVYGPLAKWLVRAAVQ